MTTYQHPPAAAKSGRTKKVERSDESYWEQSFFARWPHAAVYALSSLRTIEKKRLCSENNTMYTGPKCSTLAAGLLRPATQWHMLTWCVCVLDMCRACVQGRR